MDLTKKAYGIYERFVEEDFFDFEDSTTRKEMKQKVKSQSLMGFLLPLKVNLYKKKLKYPTFKRYKRCELFFKEQFSEKEYPELWL